MLNLASHNLKTNSILQMQSNIIINVLCLIGMSAAHCPHSLKPTSNGTQGSIPGKSIIEDFKSIWFYEYVYTRCAN